MKEDHYAFPLSFAQQRIWFLDRLEPGNPAYHISGGLLLIGPLQIDALNWSLSELVRRHETLRTVFIMEGGEPKQVVLRPRPFTVELEDHTRADNCDWEVILALAREYAGKPFELAAGPLLRVKLYRIARDRHFAVFVMHHIISDGWSSGIFVRELEILYTGYVGGGGNNLPELRLQYADYTIWQREIMTMPAVQTQLAYWTEQLSGLVTHPWLPVDYMSPAIAMTNGAQETFSLSRQLLEAIDHLSAISKTTRFMVLLAAFNILISKYCDETDIVVGIPVAGRRIREVEGLIGCFVNTLVIRTSMSGNPGFRELLERVSKVTTDAYSNQDVPFEHVVEAIGPDRSLSRNPLFEVMLALHNVPTTYRLKLPELKTETVAIYNGSARRPLTVHMWPADEGLAGHFEYNRDLFKPGTIRLMIENYVRILREVVEAPGRQLSNLSLVSQAHREQLIAQGRATCYSQHPGVGSLLDMIEEQAARFPTARAVIGADDCVDYRELNRRADHFAARLVEIGVKEEDLVCILLEASAQFVITVLGILKAGGAYLPLDIDAPAGRNEEILRQARPKALVTMEPITVQGIEFLVISPSDENPRMARPSSNLRARRLQPQNLAYVIYTSGSTGHPKGVCVEHRCLSNYVSGIIGLIGAQAGDRFALVSTFAADLGHTVLFTSLAVGGCLHVVPRDNAFSARRLGNYFREHGIDFLKIVPSHFKALTLAGDAGIIPRKGLIFGGEALTSDLLGLLAQMKPSCRLFNHYGPTETTVGVLAQQFEVPVDQQYCNGVPLGRPLPGVAVYVLDRYGNMVPRGGRGELCISGACLSRGYHGQAGETAERFVPDPVTASPGQRMYRSGDAARFLFDGTIEFLGRIDRQVKIRGYRVEPDEVQALIQNHPLVTDCVVLSGRDPVGNTNLSAYVAPSISRLKINALWDDLAKTRVQEWGEVFDETYRHLGENADPRFSDPGWISSYTRSPIPAEELQEQVREIHKKVLAYGPRSILEIGCGGGALLFEIAPQVEIYWATDFSELALNSIRQTMAGSDGDFSHVVLLKQEAPDTTEIPPEGFDFVIINSVIQYFPDLEYVLSVLRAAISVTRDGGYVFVGDVRSLDMCNPFYLSIQLAQAPPHLPLSELQRRIARMSLMEKELLIKPEFIRNLTDTLSRVQHCEVQLKRGLYRNELTCFRFDAVLSVGRTPLPTYDVGWLRWKQGQTPENILSTISNIPCGQAIGFVGVPNARLSRELKASSHLQSGQRLRNVQELSKAIDELPEVGIDPEFFWAMGDEGNKVVVSPSQGDPFHFDVVIGRRREDHDHLLAFDWKGHPDAIKRSAGPMSNFPLGGAVQHLLKRTLKEYLADRVPDYMVPDNFIALPKIPLTANGKLDLQQLSTQIEEKLHAAGEYCEPRDDLERVLCRIWEELLMVRPIGIHDDFFALGGHSLLVVRMISEVERAIGVSPPVSNLFLRPTIAQFACCLKETKGGGVLTSSLVQLNSAAEKVLFCPHASGGDVLCYHPLASELDGAVQLYGLRNIGLYSDSQPPRRIEDIASHYVKEVMQAQEQGVIWLCGWSAGGLIAFEMARQLIEAGHQVKEVFLLDTSLPNGDSEASGVKAIQQIAREMGIRAGRSFEISQSEIGPLNADERIDYLIEQLFSNGLSAGLDRLTLRRMVSVYLVNTEARRIYQPRPCPVSIKLFLATGHDHKSRSSCMGWSDLATRGFRIIPVPQTHYAMIEGAGARSLAQELRELMKLGL